MPYAVKVQLEKCMSMLIQIYCSEVFVTILIIKNLKILDHLNSQKFYFVKYFVILGNGLCTGQGREFGMSIESYANQVQT